VVRSRRNSLNRIGPARVLTKDELLGHRRFHWGDGPFFARRRPRQTFSQLSLPSNGVDPCVSALIAPDPSMLEGNAGRPSAGGWSQT
jgi:hypothetical protein